MLTSGHLFLLSSHTTRCPLHWVDRTKQTAEHVTRVHNASNLQRNNNPNLNHAHQHHCERHYDYDPVGCPTTAAIALFSVAFVSQDNATLTTNGHPDAHSLYRCKGVK